MRQIVASLCAVVLERTMVLPTPPVRCNGRVNGNSVSWSLDLRDRAGLAATQAFIDGPDHGSDMVVFSSPKLAAAAGSAGLDQPGAAATGLKATVAKATAIAAESVRQNVRGLKLLRADGGLVESHSGAGGSSYSYDFGEDISGLSCLVEVIVGETVVEAPLSATDLPLP